MGTCKQPAKVKLIIALLAKNSEYLKSAREKLKELYGEEEEVAEPFPFTWTNYYSEEVGNAPIRCLVSYEKLIDREEIVSIKHKTNEVELAMVHEKGRPVNMDPGYMTLGQFFLATTKDQRHRVYVREGIFVEVTLYFKDGAYHPFPWTYRDYASDVYRSYFLKARSKLVYQMRNERPYSQRMV